MALVHVCDYQGFGVSVDSDTGRFYSPDMNLDSSSMGALKDRIRTEVKARGLFKPFMLVERGNPGAIYGKCVNKDSRGYRLESGQYICTYSLGNLAVVPDTYFADVADKLAIYIQKREALKAAQVECVAAMQAVTSGYPALNVEKA